MKLRHATIKDLNITWYLSRKPYTQHTDYDLFYLDVCRRVFEIIEAQAKRLLAADSMPERRELMELAYVATAYFEDQVAGPGFWNTCRELIREAIGKPLPFYQTEKIAGYEAGQVNGEDLHLLLYLAMINSFGPAPDFQVSIPFGDPFLIAMSTAILNYFDAIDEIVTNDFWENFLDIRKIGYVDLKQRISWFAQHGYVFTGYLSGRVMNDVENLVEQVGRNNVAPEGLRAATYLHADIHSFQTPSNLLAIYPVDVLARLFKATDTQRAELLTMRNRPQGNFTVARRGEHYLFSHTITGEIFEVEGADLNRELPLAKATHFSTTLAKWGGAWHVSGMCLPVDAQTVAETDVLHQALYCTYHPGYRAKIRSLGVQHHGYEIEFYGAELTEFGSGGALEQRMNEYQNWLFERLRAENPELPADKKPLHIHLGDELPRSRPAAIFLPEGDNGEISLAHHELKRILQLPVGESIKAPDAMFISEHFADISLSGAYWRYMRKTYGCDVLGRVLLAPCADDADFEALLRIYRPAEFSVRKLPTFTISGDSWEEMVREPGSGQDRT